MSKQLMSDQVQAHTRLALRTREAFDKDGFSVINIEGGLPAENFQKWSDIE